MTQLHVRKTIRVGRLPLEDKAITIGRAEHNVLTLPSDQVSRKHCVIIMDDDQVRVRDLNSSNGTRLNGAKITEAVVRPGDVITVGPFEMMVGEDSGLTSSASLTGASRAAASAMGMSGSMHPGTTGSFDPAAERELEARREKLEAFEKRLAEEKDNLTAVTRRLEEKAAQINSDGNTLELEREDLRRDRVALDERAAFHDEREKTLAQHAETLETRQAELDAREVELDAREAELAARVGELDDREAAIEPRETQLAERETAVDTLARDTEARGRELDATEDRLEDLRRQLDVDRVAWETLHATQTAALAERGQALKADLDEIDRRRAELDLQTNDLNVRETQIAEQLRELEDRHQEFEQARVAWETARKELETREAQLSADLERLRQALEDAQTQAQGAESLKMHLAETQQQVAAEVREREKSEERLLDTESKLEEVFTEGRRIFVELRTKSKRLEHANNRAAWRKKRFDRLRERHRVIVRTLSSFEKSALRLLEASRQATGFQRSVRDLQLQWMELAERPRDDPMAEHQRNELKLRLDAARAERDASVQALQALVDEFGRAAARERAERIASRRGSTPPPAAPPRSVQFPLPEEKLIAAANGTASDAAPADDSETAKVVGPEDDTAVYDLEL